jgi:hypothetical protein
MQSTILFSSGELKNSDDIAMHFITKIVFLDYVSSFMEITLNI